MFVTLTGRLEQIPPLPRALIISSWAVAMLLLGLQLGLTRLLTSIRFGVLLLTLLMLGAVVGTFECGPFLIISQGSTIGQNHNRYPRIEGPLLVGPGASVLGDCHIGRNVIIGARALVIDRDIPDDTLVLGMAPDLVLKDNPEDLRLIHFDLDEIEEAA